jgi:hypothetical protein
MRLVSRRLRREALAAIVVASAGVALLHPILERSREVEARSQALNARFDGNSAKTRGVGRGEGGRIEGSPREVFAWLRAIEAAPPSDAFRIDLSIVRTHGDEFALVAELDHAAPEAVR